MVNPITVGNFAFLFFLHAGGSDFRVYDEFRLKDLSIDEMVGAWSFGCLSGPQGFTCWISFAPVFSLLMSPYLCFITFLDLDLYVLGDDALIS